MSTHSWKEWLLGRTAGMIIRPGGEQSYMDSHSTTYQETKAMLYEALIKEYRDSGMSASDVLEKAYTESEKYGPDRYPAINAELIKRHYVIIDDSPAVSKSFGGTTVMALGIEDILRNEEAISASISKGPTVLLYSGSGGDGGIRMEKVDLEETTSFAEAIQHAKDRAAGKAATAPKDQPPSDTPPPLPGLQENFDVGMWAESSNRSVSFFQ